MTPEILVATTDPQLCTTQDVKSLIGTTSTVDDVEIDGLITVASRWAESVVGYPLTAQKYRQFVPTYGTRKLVLSYMPIRSIVNGPFPGDDTGTEDEVTTTQFRLDAKAAMLDRNAGWEWTAPLMPRPFAFGLERQAWAGQERPMWMTDYVSGYTYGGIDTGSALYSTRAGSTSTGRTVPADMSRAVALKALALYEGTEGVAEKSVGDLRIRYGSYGSKAVLLDPAEQLLAPYRRMV